MYKFSLVSGVGHYKTLAIAGSQAKNKGEPELIQSVLVFPFDTYTAIERQAFVYEADQVEVRAQSDNAQIAAVNFAALQKVYWDAVAAKVTNVAGGNTLIGRALEARDYSGGVVAGNTLLIELNHHA